MEIETCRLSKPYPIVKFVIDGRDLVLSFFSYYIRLEGALKWK